MHFVEFPRVGGVSGSPERPITLNRSDIIGFEENAAGTTLTVREYGSGTAGRIFTSVPYAAVKSMLGTDSWDVQSVARWNEAATDAVRSLNGRR